MTGVEGRLATGKLTDALAEGLYHLCWAEGVKNSASFAAEYLGKNSPPLKEKAKALIKKYASDQDVAAMATTALDGLK